MLDYVPLRRFPGTRKAYDRVVATTCQECCVGCGVLAYVSEERIIDVQGDESDPISRGRLCARGSAFAMDLGRPDRIVAPAARNTAGDEFQDLEDWEAALDALADLLKKIRDQHGPAALLIGCGADASLDFVYPATRFAALWGTPYVFNPFDEPLDSSGRPNVPDSTCSDWINSRCLFFIGTDPAVTHPVAFGRALEAQTRGAVLVVADTRFTATMSKADIALRIKPQAGNVLGFALMKLMVAGDMYSKEAVEALFQDPTAWSDSFERMPLDEVVAATGLHEEELRGLAILLSKKGAVQVITGKRLAHLPGHGIWRTLSAAMGSTGKPGGGWYPLDSGRPHVDVLSDIERSDWENAFRSQNSDPVALMNGLLPGGPDTEGNSVKAVIASGNVLEEWAGGVGLSAEDPGLLAYFGSSPNQTWSRSQVVLPASHWAETDRLTITNDRRVRWAPRIVEPSDKCRSGLDLWIGLATRMGWAAHFPWIGAGGRADQRSFSEWLLDHSPATTGCKSAVFAEFGAGSYGVTWPGASDEIATGKVTPVLASSLPKASFETDPESEQYPLWLEYPRVDSPEPAVGTSSLTGTMEAPDAVEINPEIANALDIQNGDRVVLQGPGSTRESRAGVSRSVPRELVYARAGTGDTRVLLYKKGRTGQEALAILKDLLQ